MLASAPPRQVVIPFTFETAGHYKTVLMNAVTGEEFYCMYFG